MVGGGFYFTLLFRSVRFLDGVVLGLGVREVRRDGVGFAMGMGIFGDILCWEGGGGSVFPVYYTLDGRYFVFCLCYAARGSWSRMFGGCACWRIVFWQALLTLGSVRRKVGV